MPTFTTCARCGGLAEVSAGQNVDETRCMMCAVDETTGNVTFIRGL